MAIMADDNTEKYDDFSLEDPRSNREKMLAGDYYIADDPVSGAIHTRARRLADAYHRASLADEEAAQALLAELVGELGEGVVVRSPLYVDYGDNLFIGDRTFINFNLTALDVVSIRIGEDCQIGPNVQLLTAIHPIDPDPRREKWEAGKPIQIGDNVWLGGGVIVCPGVSIGDNSVIGAGAVVTKDIPANVVAVGNPARVIRKMSPGSSDENNGESN